MEFTKEELEILRLGLNAYINELEDAYWKTLDESWSILETFGQEALVQSVRFNIKERKDKTNELLARVNAQLSETTE